jgi:hypothetical protein
MVSASVGNVMACLMLEEEAGEYWLTAPAVDVRNALEELERLQRIEAALTDRINAKRQERDSLLKDSRACRDEWQIEDALYYERKAWEILAEITELEDFLNA